MDNDPRAVGRPVRCAGCDRPVLPIPRPDAVAWACPEGHTYPPTRALSAALEARDRIAAMERAGSDDPWSAWWPS